MAVPGPNEITRCQLSNGIVLLVRENHASPAVVVTGYVQVGAYDEPAEKAGLADFAAEMLMRGTSTQSLDKIYGALESVGARLGFSGGTHSTGFGGKSLAEDLHLVVDILADVLREPVFPVADVAKLREEILADLAERAHDTARMANLAFHELAYPNGHPYAVSSSGYPETICAIDREDLVAFYGGGYGPQGMVVVVVGAVEASEVRVLFEEALGDWEGALYERDPLPPVERLAEVRKRLVEIPDKSQSNIVLGYPGPPRRHPDFLEARVCNTILGVFGLMGRLGENVRDEQGLAYTAYSSLGGGPGPGPWRIMAGVDPVNVGLAVDSILLEITRMCDELVDQDELRDSRAYLTGTMPLQLETNEGVARTILGMERYGLGLDYLQQYEELIQAVTAEQVRMVARRWLSPDTYALAIAGPPAR